jgi:Fe-S cluster assembly ATP-binding protein
MLAIEHLSASIDQKKILHDISFSFAAGKTYAILGPNGSGKSTLSSAIMGHPNLILSRASKILWNEKNIKNLSPDKRAALGISMTFQNPLALAGVSARDLLRLALEKKYDVIVLYQKIQVAAKALHIKEELLSRSLNDGFSGGEKKKLEALQIALLEPRFVLFDEIDTGVDVDALKAITLFLKQSLPKESTLVFITHSAKLLKYMRPDHVLVMKEGRLIATGDQELAARIERSGFESLSS